MDGDKKSRGFSTDFSRLCGKVLVFYPEWGHNQRIKIYNECEFEYNLKYWIKRAIFDFRVPVFLQIMVFPQENFMPGVPH